MQQTGQTQEARASFLWRNYLLAVNGRLINTNWQPEFEHPPAF